MMTPQQWHQGFITTNGREPTMEEYQSALRNGEFQKNTTPDHVQTPADTQQPVAPLQSAPAIGQETQPSQFTAPQPAQPQQFPPSPSTPYMAAPQQNTAYQQPYQYPQQPLTPPGGPATQPTQKASFNVTAAINRLAGGEGAVDINLKDTFSNVLKKHSRKEAERIFIGGTTFTTPREGDIAATWPRPWLFSRILVFFIATYVLLYFLQSVNEIVPSYVGLIFIGALAVPFSTLIFFFECNAPRNISFWSVLQMLFIGGVLSLIATMFLDRFTAAVRVGWFLPLMTAIAEELAKLAALAVFVKILKPRYILNGLLIGGAIGAGFDGFETAGYGFDALTSVLTKVSKIPQMSLRDFLQTYGFPAMNSTLIQRGWQTIGGHVAWAAITGAALLIAMNGDKLQTRHFLDRRFLSLFWIPIALHTAWDLSSIDQIGGIAFFNSNLYYLILIVLAWTVLFVIINSGLQQISRLQTIPGNTAQRQQ